MKHCVFTQLQEEKKKREEEVQRKNQELQEKTDQMEGSKDEAIKKERRDKEKAQSEVKILKDQLESKNKESNNKQAEVQQLQQQIKKMESGLQTLMKDLDSDTLERSPPSHSGSSSSGPTWSLSPFGGNKAQVQSVPLSKWPEMLRQKFQEKLQKKITESNNKQAEVQQLQQQIKKMESDLQTLMKDLDSDTLERSPPSHSGSSSSGPTRSFPQFGGNKAQVQSVPLSKWPEMLRQKFQEKLQKKITEIQFKEQQAEVQRKQIEKMETSLQTLMEDLDSGTLEDLKKHISSVSGKSSSSLSDWMLLLMQKFQEELQKRKEAEEKVQTLEEELQTKTTEKQNSSSLSQNSTTGPAVVFKVDRLNQYIQLINTSTQDQQLGGWNLKIQVNNNKPVIHQFTDSFNLKADQHFTVGYCWYGSSYPPADLVLEDQKSWSYTDKPQVSLISNTGKIQYNLDRI
ncbi:lamin-B2-like isoform X1 [Acanthopagrus latus]|uniref:lamin-B2-like isoform X1 n=1 Tax=Acanthopagrus latus TaxID=8177 RepID=UPI00187CEE20|nr:lamin-B2-like isoform X1 [Acanthopagrus latus]